MSHKPVTRLNPKKRYLQVALNSTLEDAHDVITQLPISDRIIVEAGTPLIKRYGERGIRQIRQWYEQHVSGQFMTPTGVSSLSIASLFSQAAYYGKTSAATRGNPVTSTTGAAGFPYVVADLKTMDRGETEVEIAARGGASAAIALGNTPIETLTAHFINPPFGVA